MFCPTGGRVGWDCYVLPTAGWDGNVTPYRRLGGMGLLRPTGGVMTGMFRISRGRVGWDCYVIPAAEGWECYALPAAGWDGIATPYRRQGGMDCYVLPAAW